MIFPADIKGCMRVCILSIFWARKDIFAFFKDHDCTTSDLCLIEKFKDRNLSRAAMVDQIFTQLDSRIDGGLGPFRAMLQSLNNWTHFDPYYFDELKKLNRAAAERNIAHLRQLTEIRDAKIKEDRKQRESEEAENSGPGMTCLNSATDS